MYRLRNTKDLDCVLDEVAGNVGGKELVELHDLATKEPYSVLHVNLVSPKSNDTFYNHVNQKLQIQ